MDQHILKEAIARIQSMEACFNALSEAVSARPSSAEDDPDVQCHLNRLIAYYEGGQWLHDYELDEAGLLPENLRRGVLSQDAVYDLLTRLKRKDSV